MQKDSPEGMLALLAAIGAAVGIGKLLSSQEPLRLRIIIGRAIVSGGLGASAGVILTTLPTAPNLAQYGLAAALSSLGTSAIERMLSKYIPKGDAQ